MSDFGEVRVKLGLDTSGAQKNLDQFFSKLRSQNNIPDPFKGLDKNFDKIADQAKKLGFAWDSVTKKFKNDGGFTQNLSQMKSTLTALGGTNQKTAADFDKLAQRIKGSADSWKFITDGARQYQAQQQQATAQAQAGSAALTKLGAAAKPLGNDFKTVSSNAQALKGSLKGFKVDGLKTISSDAKSTGSSFKTLEGTAKALGVSLKSLKPGGNLKQIGVDAQSANAGTRALGIGIKTLGGNLKNTAASTGALRPLGTTLQTINGGARTAGTGVGVLAQKLREVGTSKTGLQTAAQALPQISTKARAAGGDMGKLSQTFNQSGQQAKGFGDTVRSSFNNILQGIPQGIGLAIGNFLISPLKLLAQVIPSATQEFAELDRTIQLTLSIVGVGADKFGELQQSILRVSSATAATAGEVGKVAQALSRAGFDLQEIDAALEGIVKGAEATGTSYEEMGKIVVSALGAFGLAAADASDVADTLTVAANGANTDVTQLGDALKYVGPIANAVGQDLQGTSVQLQVLANSGIQASTAGTSLRTILTNLQIAAGGAGEEFTALSRGSGRLQKALALIGADMTDANGELKTGTELIKALQTAMIDLDPGERAIISKVLAGSEGLPALNALISATGAELDEFAAAMEGRAGAAADTAQQALQGLAGSFDLLQSNLSAALIEIGSLIAKGLQPLVDITTAVLSTLNNLPGPIKSAAVALGLLGAAIGAVVVTMNVLKGTIIATFAAQTIAAITNFTKALTAANIQTSIANMVNGLSALGTAAKVNILGAMASATEIIKGFTKALKEGTIVKTFTDLLGGISKGFQGIGAAGQATQLTLDFASAGGTAAKSAGGLKGVLAGLAAKFGLAGSAGAAGATGIAVTGGAAAGAAPAVLGLAGALGGLLVAIAPIAAAIGAVALAFVYLKDRLDAYKEITEPLAESQKTLDDALEKTTKEVENQGFAYTSWGKNIEDALGPLDRLLNLTGPVYHGIKLIAEALGRLNNWDRANQQIIAAAVAHKKFKESLQETNDKIEENRQKMAALAPESQEYGRLAKENADLIGAEQTAIEQRIEAIDQQIAKLKENEGVNGRQIEFLEKMKNKYQEQLPILKANTDLIRQEQKAHEDAGGAIENFTAKMGEAADARQKAYAKADTKVIQTEIKALNQLKEGLISEAEQRAINARAAAEASGEKIDAVEKEITELKAMYQEGGITHEQYKEAVATATKDIGDEIQKRVEAEQAAAKATAAAIDAALQEYDTYVQTIGQNIQTVNNMLGELGSVGSAGISAFKSLADAVTNYELQSADRVRDRQIKNTEDRFRRRKTLLEAAGKDTKALDKQLAREKQRIENEYARERKRIMTEQIRFEEAAVKATIAQKKIELDLWYAQQKVSNQIAEQQAQIAILQAKANGASPEQLAALQEVLRLTQEQGSFLGEMYGLKQNILEIEGLTEKQNVATKAAAEGITSEFGNQVTSVGNVRRAMENFLGDVSNAQERMTRIGDGLDPIPNRAEEVARDVVKKIESGVSGVSFEEIKQNFIDAKIPPAVAEQQARVIVDAYADAGIDAGQAAGNNIAARFQEGGTIPKELVKQELINAMVQGANVSMDEAKARFARFENVIPVEQVATILGNAVGGGAEEGMRQLAETPLPEGVFAPLGTDLKTEIAGGGNDGLDAVRALADGYGELTGKGFGVRFVSMLNPALNTAELLFENFGVEPLEAAASAIKGMFENAGKEGETAIVNALGETVPVADKTAETVGKKFEGLIPKEAVKNDLLNALFDGTRGGLKKAEDEFKAMPDVLPREEVARIIGESIGEGVEAGERILNLFTLTPEAQAKLEGAVGDSLEQGAKDGSKAVGEEMKNTDAIRDGVRSGLSDGINEGLSTFPSAVNEATKGLDTTFERSGVSAGQTFSDAFNDKFNDAIKGFDKNFDKIKFTNIGNNLKEQLTQPIQDAEQSMSKIALSPDIVGQATAIQNMANEVASSGMGKEFNDANDAARQMRTATNNARNSANSLLGMWRRIANEARKAANAARGAGRARWTGGPVQGGQSYQVNEIGREMFLSNSGRLTEIKAPAWGDWRAPSSGTVIPANISAQIRENMEATKADHSISMLQDIQSPAAARPMLDNEGGGFERALLGQLAKMNTAQGAVTNNVSITSANPIGDASKVMADLARLRAMRRR